MFDGKVTFSVSSLLAAVSASLRDGFKLVSVRGEVAQITRASSGHWYLTLKDDGAQVKAVMFRQRNVQAGFLPKLGDKVEATAEVAVYEPRGDLQLILQTLKPAGQGNLYEQFLRLKERLAADGLFDMSRKKSLPTYVFSVGIVTSPQAAAFADVKRALNRRAPHVQWRLYPSLVQGEAAPEQLIAAIRKADKGGHDAILLIRGGGSLEDLWSFNNEMVVKTIFDASTPIVSGVGHESDVTLTDLVADLRAATPTAAAEQASKPTAELLAQLAYLDERARDSFSRFLMLREQRVDRLEAEILSPYQRLEALADRVSAASKHLSWLAKAKLRQADESINHGSARLPFGLKQQINLAQNSLTSVLPQLKGGMKQALLNQSSNLQACETLLEANSVQRNLDKGFAILQTESGEIVSSVSGLDREQKARATVSDGHFDILVEQKTSR